MQIIKRDPSRGPRKPLYIIKPEEYEKKPITGRIATFDTETDPFAEGRIVKPFTCGFYIIDSDEYFDFWGDDCIDQFFAFMAANYEDEEFTIFVHNGGNFDFYFLTDYFDEGMTPFIINGRLVRITCRGFVFRDSYAMIPVALGNAMKSEDGGKIEIDYSKLERECREEHKDEIRIYQRQDCIALATLVSEWLDMFGNRLTMASVALPMLRSYHGFETLPEFLDNAMRPYYFGGRCQAFETGVLDSDVGFVGYDVTSSYPDVMRRMQHPISGVPMYEPRITERTHFAKIRAWSNGALPVRKEDGGLDFPIGVRDFFACIHEIRAGLKTGTLRIHRVYESVYFQQYSTFSDFIDTFFALRQEAGANNDEVKKLFYKLVMNSSYGKFAQDPRKYESWLFDPVEIPAPLLCEPCHARAKAKLPKEECTRCDPIDGTDRTHDAYGWYLHTVRDNLHIYARPQRPRAGAGFFNVATAASITSAARATLLRGLRSATRPIYCDTDSIICEGLQERDGVAIDPKALGAWKEEFRADKVCVAGKKLYAIFQDGECIKKASKGVKLSGEEIERICLGETVEYANPVPKFSLFKVDGKNIVRVNDKVSAEFVNRRITRTGGFEYERSDGTSKLEAPSFRF